MPTVCMPKYSVNVLCANDDVCEEVQSTIMNDYKIKKSDGEDGFDHYGVKEFDSIDDALNEARRLKETSGGKIIHAMVSNA